MSSILLAIDIVSESDHALERAINLALSLTATLHIIHVCPPSSEKNMGSPSNQGVKDKLNSYVSSNKKLTSLEHTITVKESREPFAEIIKLAEQVKAGLIVMGMHGKGKLRDMFVGTTIEKVIRKGNLPVLMVKHKPLGGYGNVLVGTDFSAGSSQALELAFKLAPKGNLNLLHLYFIPDTYIGDKISQYAGDVIETTEKDKLEQFVNDSLANLKRTAEGQPDFHYRLAQGEAYTGLLREAAEKKAELVAIGAHSRPRLLPYKLGGTAHDILTNPPCDVLVANTV